MPDKDAGEAEIKKRYAPFRELVDELRACGRPSFGLNMGEDDQHNAANIKYLRRDGEILARKVDVLERIVLLFIEREVHRA